MTFKLSGVREAAARSRAHVTVLYRWYQLGTAELLWLTDLFGARYGHARSARLAHPINAAGEPVPWYTFPALEYLTQFDFHDWDVFEFGGGNSSKFWSRRCGSLTTVESDRAWHATLAGEALPRQRLLFEDDPVRYADAVTESGRRYKLIVIDGVHRRACAERAVDRLEPGGLIVFDNSDWWPETCAYLRGRGLTQVDFTGPGPINRYTWTTSLFFGSRVDLTLLTARQPVPGIGSLPQVANPE